LFRGSYPDAPILWLDSGSFSGDASMAGRLQTETLIEGMNRLGYAAANVTDREMIGGLERFLEVAKQAKFPLISANIVFQDSGRSILPPYTVVTIPPESWRGTVPLRVGIMGLARVRPAFLETTKDGKKIIIAPPIPVAAKLVPTLARETDVLILLTNMNSILANRLLQQVPGIDLVLAGSSDRIADNQALPPATRVLYAGSQGKRLGEVRLFLGQGRVMNHTAGHLFLDRRYTGESTMEELETAGNARINDYYRKLADEKPVRVAANLPAKSRYVGAESCQECHSGAFEVWQRSGHQHAIQTLIEAGQEYNPLCVSCHVTGFQTGNGFQNFTATPAFAGVQCEECHGPAGAHIEDPNLPYGKTGQSKCLSCHTSDNSPEFEFPPYWESVRH